MLPFEDHWYAARGHDVHYVGNPLLLKYANENMYEEGKFMLRVLACKKLSA